MFLFSCKTRSLKLDQYSSNDWELFLEKFKQNVKKKMQHLEEVCDGTLASEDYERIRANKMVLASVSTP